MSREFDADYASALDAAAAIRHGAISSVELTAHTLERIAACEPALHAYVYVLRDEALAAARRADEALARKEVTGPLHGVPVNVKESFGVEGRPCTWGIPGLKDSRAPRHATAVQRLLDAGAVLLGATNVPFQLMDGQAFNDIYGTTNNPWDLSRTPGGSSGGSAASLAAGTAFLSIGSDIGGSIRSPASFCGVYGHKPTLDIVPMTGHMPGGMTTPSGFSTLLAVAGPMARTADDLEAALRALAGFEPPETRALQWRLPASRHEQLRDFRIGFVLEDPAVPVSSDTLVLLESVIQACERAGATVTRGWPPGVDFAQLLGTYFYLLGALDFSLTPPDARDMVRTQLESRPGAFAEGALGSFAEWQAQNIRRVAYRAMWQRYFGQFDVFLLPTTFTEAFPHDHRPPDVRTLTLPQGGERPFWDLVTYITPATLTGCPATTAPVGRTRNGLPVGLQIVAPFLEDATSITFAGLLAQEIGGFEPPPGYRRPAAG